MVTFEDMEADASVLFFPLQIYPSNPFFLSLHCLKLFFKGGEIEVWRFKRSVYILIYTKSGG